MKISKINLIQISKIIDISNHKMSPRGEFRADFQAPVGEIDSDGYSDSEFDDFEEDSGFFSSYDQDSTTLKRGSSVKKFNLPLKELVVKRRSSVKHAAQLKETPIVRDTLGKSSLHIHHKRLANQEHKARVRDTLEKSSLHLHRKRLLCSSLAPPKAT